MAVGEIEHLSIFSDANQYDNKLSIKLGGFQILQIFWCRNNHAHNAMFCRIYTIEHLPKKLDF